MRSGSCSGCVYGYDRKRERVCLSLDVLRPEGESRYVDIEGLKERRKASARSVPCGVCGAEVVRECSAQ